MVRRSPGSSKWDNGKASSGGPAHKASTDGCALIGQSGTISAGHASAGHAQLWSSAHSPIHLRANKSHRYPLNETAEGSKTAEGLSLRARVRACEPWQITASPSFRSPNMAQRRSAPRWMCLASGLGGELRRSGVGSRQHRLSLCYDMLQTLCESTSDARRVAAYVACRSGPRGARRDLGPFCFKMRHPKPSFCGAGAPLFEAGLPRIAAESHLWSLAFLGAWLVRKLHHITKLVTCL